MEQINPYAGLCDIIDCINNKDELCSLNFTYTDKNCLQHYSVPERIKKKEYTAFFDPRKCKAITLNSPSKGAQDKWINESGKYVIKDRFQYQMRYWNDDLVEVIASNIGEQLGINIVHQELCKLGDKDCSFSANWGKKRFIPYDKIDKELAYINYNDPTDRVKFIIDVLSEAAACDAEEYVRSLLTIDLLVGNEDRHEENFGILIDSHGKTEIAPIFDCGLGLFEHDIRYNTLTLEESIKVMECRTFGSWEKIHPRYFMHGNTYTVKKSLLPNRLAEDYLKYSAKKLDSEVIICD